MSSAQAAWQDALMRECGIRRGLVLHGNVNDVVPDPTNADRWVSVPDAVASMLKNRGYRHVVRWDRTGGITGIEQRVWRELQANAVTASSPTSGGEAYDMSGGDSASPSGPTAGSMVEVTPPDFLAVVAHHMKQTGPERIAFIVDWSQYLFGTANALSEAERSWLLLMGKATRDSAISLGATDVERPQTLMVLLCQGLAVLPPSLYLNNPLFKEINLPLPTRQQREDAVQKLSAMLSIDPPALPQSRVLADLVDSLEGLTLRDISQRLQAVPAVAANDGRVLGQHVSVWGAAQPVGGIE